MIGKKLGQLCSCLSHAPTWKTWQTFYFPNKKLKVMTKNHVEACLRQWEESLSVWTIKFLLLLSLNYH